MSLSKDIIDQLSIRTGLQQYRIKEELPYLRQISELAKIHCKELEPINKILSKLRNKHMFVTELVTISFYVNEIIHLHRSFAEPIIQSNLHALLQSGDITIEFLEQLIRRYK